MSVFWASFASLAAQYGSCLPIDFLFGKFLALSITTTKVPISGHYQDPNIDFWSAAFGVVKNAFLQTLQSDFDKPEITPAPEKQNISDKALDKAVNQGVIDKDDLQKKAEAAKANPRP